MSKGRTHSTRNVLNDDPDLLDNLLRGVVWMNGYMDGSPEDSLLDGSNRWHTIAFMSGNDDQTIEFVGIMQQIAREHNKYWRPQKWYEPDAKKREPSYREDFATFFPIALKRMNAPALAWSFQEDTVRTLKGRYIQELHIDPASYTNDFNRKGRLTASFVFKQEPIDLKNQASLITPLYQRTPLMTENQLLMLLAMADAILTSLRDIERAARMKYGDRPVHMKILTDYIQGDDADRQPGGEMLAMLLERSRPGVFQTFFRGRNERCAGELIADNLCGILTEFQTKPDSELTKEFLPTFLECQRIHWGQVNPDFTAKAMRDIYQHKRPAIMAGR